jgi:hypothetical protein
MENGGIMKYKTTKPNIEVYFDNGCKVGTITYDFLWNEWRINFEKDIRLSYHYLKDIYKYVRGLKCLG